MSIDKSTIILVLFFGTKDSFSFHFIRSSNMLQPLHDNLLVKLDEVKERKEGGLILPESAKEKSKIALVLEVGPGKLNKDGTRSEPIVKKGDRILFRNYAEHKFTHEGEDFLIVSESDVLAIVSL